MASYTFDELLNVIEIQIANLPTYFTELGATSADVDRRTKWRDNMIAARDYAEEIDVAKKTAFGIKDFLKSGSQTTPVPAYAPISTGTMPDPSQNGGYEDIVNQDNRRWMASPGCTPEIITACALKKHTTPDDPTSVQPKVECDAAQSGNAITVITKNRGESDMYDILGCPVTESEMKLIKSANTRSTDVTLPPKEGGGSQQWWIQVQLKQRGENYGQPSDAVRVTANP